MTRRRPLREIWVAGPLALFVLQGNAWATDGYILDPSGKDSTREVEPQGMSQIRKMRRRTPAGFLHPYPLEPQTLHEIGNGWLAGASIEAGGLVTFQDDDETRFSRYADWSQNFLVHSFDLAFLQPERGLFAKFHGNGVGRNDQSLAADVSWLGRARLRIDHSGLPRSYAKDARTLHQGIGGETLTLLPGLTPGNNTDADLITALTGQGNRNLSVQRDETKIQLDIWPRSDTRLIARFESQDRDGERPYGGSWLYTALQLGRAVELITPVDDHTYKAEAAVQFAREALQINAGYEGSYYRNPHDDLTWDNPFLLSGASAPLIERGRMALAPENDFHNFHVDVATQLPLSGRAAFSGSWSRMEQDDRLLPPTVNSGNIGTLDLDQWNTSSALARNSANARVETLLLSGDLAFRPWKRLRLGARARYFDRDNETSYRARNPLTDEWGYITEDGALAAAGLGLNHQTPIANPDAAEDFRFRSTPYGYDELEIESRADVTLPGRTRLGARYAWEHKGYDERERSATDEHRVRVTLSTRAHERANVRVSYRYANRDGDDYNPDPYRAYYVSGLPGGPAEQAFTLNQLRKSDVANREQHEVELRWNLLLSDSMDLSFAGRFRDDEYGSSYGLKAERAGSISADWSYSPSQDFSAHLMGSWERLERRQSNINDSLAGIGSADGNAGGVLFPLANRWRLDSDQDSVFAGAGLTWRMLSRVTVDASYRLIHTRQRIDYEFATNGALGALFVVSGADPGRRFPVLETVDHVVESSVRLQVAEHVALRVFHRFQRGALDDFQQKRLDDPTLLSGTPGTGTGVLFLGHRDRDYSAHVIGGTVQLRFF